jgi:tRNA A-37 threonylcarbamoyl transferase component Bud32
VPTPLKLEDSLRRLPEIGTLVKDRPYRQVWRFEHDGRAYFLKFYPREVQEDRFHKLRDRFRRWTRGSHAMLEFTRLQNLQKAGIPSPRAVAAMVGFQINGRRGDAVIIEAIEPSIQLDHYLREFEQRGQFAPDHREISRQVRELVHQLARAGLGHEDLHLGNLLLHAGKIYLLDAYSVRRGMRGKDVYRLAHSARPFATLTDLLRGWNLLAGGPMPQENPMTPRLRKDFLTRIRDDDRYFGKLASGDWRGNFFRSTKFPKPWSQGSRLTVQLSDWEQQWPELLSQIERDELPVIKRTRSGDVLSAELRLGQKRVPVVIKRPRKRYWYRYIFDAFRRSRSWRSWMKGWSLISRGLPTAWPLLVMEKRSHGYIVDSFIVFERVPGVNFRRYDLDALSPEQRDMLLRRAGRILRMIDHSGMSHFDAKASNWIIREDEHLGPSPVLIDTDAVRFRRWPGLGMERLLRSMREHEQYTPADSLSLCLGYTPYSPPTTGAKDEEDKETRRQGDKEPTSVPPH